MDALPGALTIALTCLATVGLWHGRRHLYRWREAVRNRGWRILLPRCRLPLSQAYLDRTAIWIAVERIRAQNPGTLPIVPPLPEIDPHGSGYRVSFAGEWAYDLAVRPSAGGAHWLEVRRVLPWTGVTGGPGHALLLYLLTKTMDPTGLAYLLAEETRLVLEQRPLPWRS